MKKTLLSFLLGFAIALPMSLPVAYADAPDASPADRIDAKRQLCDNGGAPKADRVFTFTHNGNDFKPRLQVKYQTGGWCSLTGDYVWGKFIYNTQPGDADDYPVVNQNGAAEKILFANDYSMILTMGGAFVAQCDNTPGDDHEDGEGCDNSAWVSNPGQHGEVGKTQTEKYNCDRNGHPGATYNTVVSFRIRWSNGDVTGPYEKTLANGWDSLVSQCDGG